MWDDRREGKWEEGVIRSNYCKGETRSKERIKLIGGRIEWREI